MVIKTIEARVHDVFVEGSDSREFGEKYLETVVQNWKDVHSAIRRTAVLNIALVVAFVLLAAPAGGAQLTLGPLKFVSVVPVWS